MIPSARTTIRVPAHLAHRSLPATLVVAITLAIGACSGGSGGGSGDRADVALPALLSEEQLGDGWVASNPGEVDLLPGTIAPPCPFAGDVPEFEIRAADSIEFGDETRRLGINHTVVELNGAAASARAVLDTWVSMDCADSDADQRPVEGLPGGVFGVELDTIDSDFTQAVLIRVTGSTMSFLVVTGDGDTTIDVARDLAPLI